MAALDRLDDLEEFVLSLQPDEVFRPRRVWQFPGGLHDYTLPRRSPTASASAEELGTGARRVRDRARRLRHRRERSPGEERRAHFELAYASHSTAPETMGSAILASAAVSGLVLPVTIDGVIATDGGWVRNFPLEHAYRNPEVKAIAAFATSRATGRPTSRSWRRCGNASIGFAQSRRSGPCSRDPARGGARRTRRARPLRGDDRASDAGRNRSQHRARGAPRGGAETLGAALNGCATR